MWLAQWLIAAATIAQAAGPSTPATAIIRQRTFAVPYKLEQVDDPARQPVEVQLYVSSDQGARWHFYAKTQPTQPYFMFRTAADGEYWFAIRTIDRSGQARPATVTTPGLKVKVIAAGDGQTSPHNALRPDANDKPPASGGADAQRSAAAPPALLDAGGAAVGNVNPPFGNNYGAAHPSRPAVDPFSFLPPGERPRMVNARRFELEYDVESVGPSGIGRVELWGTADGGKNWSKYAVDDDNRSPITVNVAEEGVYGFRLVVSNGAGVGGEPPKTGDQPEMWIAVDLTKPTARIVSAQQGEGDEAGRLIISWQADDRSLAARPITLLFSATPGGPWLPIAGGMENTGRYAWPLDERIPPRVYLRLEVRDEAGNIGADQTPEAVVIDQTRPKLRLRDIRAVGQ